VPRRAKIVLAILGVSVAVYVITGLVTGDWQNPPGTSLSRTSAAHSAANTAHHANPVRKVTPAPARTRAERPAAYKATVVSSLPVNPADLAVTVRVRNTGTESGTPECTINASDPSGTYHGFDIATFRGRLRGGQVAAYTDQVVITSQGSAYVTSVSVHCTGS